MANWKYKMNLVDLKEKYENKEITVETLGEEMAKRLRNLKMSPKDKQWKEDLENIATQFESCCNDEDDFNSILNNLYDWADMETSSSNSVIRNRLCWIGFAF